MSVPFDHDADPEGCEGPCHESVVAGWGFYILELTPYSRMPGPTPPHGFSNRNRVRQSAVGLKESLTPAVNRLTSTGVFV